MVRGSVEPPTTRSRTSGAREADAKAESLQVQKALSFLEEPRFSADAHLNSFYRLAASDPAAARVFLREKGDCADAAGGFPNPFLAVDLNDKHGLWNGEQHLLKSLGDDPSALARKLTASGRWQPAGLKNLGATCYLNSLLQYLFFNLDFRSNLLWASSQSSVVAALQHVFSLLAEGDMCSVDTSDFVAAAGVDAVAQQDATEFSAILLEWLQRELAPSHASHHSTSLPSSAATPLPSSHASFIPALFEGELCQLVSCARDASHSSERRESFTELRARLSPEASDDAALKRNRKRSVGKNGKATEKATVVQLEELIQETALPDEMLDGSNQWHCPKCDCKVDARKVTRLAKLPPYLHVTIERYHYDRRTFERKRLGHTVSFPRRLQLHLDESSSELRPPVVFECIGFLEHVSDSAHSGHYRATLLQEGPVAQEHGASEEGPATKRPRCDGADAAGMPRQGVWWTLDDETVTEVSWNEEMRDGDQAAPVGSEAPERIESSTAYLLLYRRLDHQPGQLAPEPSALQPLPQSLADFLASANGALRSKRQSFTEQSQALMSFASQRRLAIDRLIEGLRAEAVPLRAEHFSFVPSSWLKDFLRGERGEELTEGALAPVLYGRSLLPSRTSCGAAMDPMALWCGEVKLLPSAILSSMRGLGGFSDSLFLPAEAALDPETCRSAQSLFKAWCHEQQLVEKLMRDCRLSSSDARLLGKASDAVWISQRLNKLWGKLAVVGAGTSGPQMLRARFQAFLEELRSLRFEKSREPEETAEKLKFPSEETSEKPPFWVSLQGPLLCRHGLVCKPRSAFLAKRADVEAVLQAALRKEEAYRAMFKEARAHDVPRLVSGLPGGQLCSFNDVCLDCNGTEASGQGSGTNRGKRTLTLKRRFQSGILRKLALGLEVALSGPITAAQIVKDVKDQHKFQVLRLWSSRALGEEAEIDLKHGVVEEDVDTLIVEKDEVEREAAAFEGTVFRARLDPVERPEASEKKGELCEPEQDKTGPSHDDIEAAIRDDEEELHIDGRRGRAAPEEGGAVQMEA